MAFPKGGTVPKTQKESTEVEATAEDLARAAAVKVVLATMRAVHEKLMKSGTCADLLVVRGLTIALPHIGKKQMRILVTVTRTSLVFHQQVDMHRGKCTLVKYWTLSNKQAAEEIINLCGPKQFGQKAVDYVLDHLFTNLIKALETLSLK